MVTVYNRIGWFRDKIIAVLNKYVSNSILLSKIRCEVFIRAGLSKQCSTVLYYFHYFVPTSKSPVKKTELHLFLRERSIGKGILELLHVIEQLLELKCHSNVCGNLTDNSIKEVGSHSKINYVTAYLSSVMFLVRTRPYCTSSLTYSFYHHTMRTYLLL